MSPKTTTTELNDDVSDVLASIREELGDDEPWLDMTTLDEDVDEDERVTGVFYAYVPSDWETDDGVSTPEVLAGTVVHAPDGEALAQADGLDTLVEAPPSSRRDGWRRLQRRYLTRISAGAAMLALLMAIAAWVAWPRPTDLERQRQDVGTADAPRDMAEP